MRYLNIYYKYIQYTVQFTRFQPKIYHLDTVHVYKQLNTVHGCDVQMTTVYYFKQLNTVHEKMTS